MDENGHYSGEFESLVKVVGDINRRTTQHTNLLGSMTEHLAAIANNTATVAKHYGEVQTDNRTLTKNLMRILLAVLTLVAVYAIADNLKNSGLEVRIPWLGIEITQHEPKS